MFNNTSKNNYTFLYIIHAVYLEPLLSTIDDYVQIIAIEREIIKNQESLLAPFIHTCVLVLHIKNMQTLETKYLNNIFFANSFTTTS